MNRDRKEHGILCPNTCDCVEGDYGRGHQSKCCGWDIILSSSIILEGSHSCTLCWNLVFWEICRLDRIAVGTHGRRCRACRSYSRGLGSDALVVPLEIGGKTVKQGLLRPLLEVLLAVCAVLEDRAAKEAGHHADPWPAGLRWHDVRMPWLGAWLFEGPRAPTAPRRP